MLVAGIDVSLGPHLAHTVKVVDVDVDKHPEQTRQNLLSHLHEGLREGSTWKSNRWRQKNTTVNPGWPFAICSTEPKHTWNTDVFDTMVIENFSYVFNSFCNLFFFVLWSPSAWVPACSRIQPVSLHPWMENQHDLVWGISLCSSQVINLVCRFALTNSIIFQESVPERTRASEVISIHSLLYIVWPIFKSIAGMFL